MRSPGLGNSMAAGTQIPRFHSRQLHNIPKNGLPIIFPPYQPSDFFTDIDPENVARYAPAIDKMISLFPPPLAPAVPVELESHGEGIMIPFIFPPPPVIKPDPYIDDNAFFLRKRKSFTDQKSPLLEPVELAPLPFPPRNFMPYPLDASKATLTPHDVFTDFLDASTILPRTDMVVASAAGTLTDFKYQADKEGFSIQEYDIDKKRKSQSDAYDRAAEEENSSYYDQINVTDQYDKMYRGLYDPFEPSASQHLSASIQANLSNVKNKPVDKEYSSLLNYKERVLSRHPEAKRLEKYTSYHKSDLNKKRESLLMSLTDIESRQELHKHHLLKTRKKQLITKLRGLRASTVYLTDNENQHLVDEQLAKMKDRMAEDRDSELVKLKFEFNYEVLRQLTSFYQDSDKIYRKFQGTTLNKLLKLMNFFEFQKKQFQKLLESRKMWNELTDLTNKESSKLYSDISERNYGPELKEILKLKLAMADNRGTAEDEARVVQMIENLHTNTFSDSMDKFSDVTDFMPLVSSKEFDLITTNLNKQKNDVKMNMNVKHQIFRSALYESGSDSTYASSFNNSTTSVPDTPKRRGRRSNLEVDEENLNSETFLLAKISKHFVGPQPVNQDQMNEDFEVMGIKSKWK
ncbi:hypothetical protein PSN45_000948 [Yamadazyma tenuis]|nr:hypothetical protein PSN45_000948 [Yamadazyma tenuis]